jgi:hypothetical protein
MADYYETLAAGYDWIFDDDALARGLAISHPGTARLLQRTSDASAVLDAACGIVQLADSAVTRHGRRCIVLYAWEIPDRLDQEHVAHIVLIFEDGSRIEPREYRIGFHPARTARGGRLEGGRYRLRRCPRPLRHHRRTGLAAEAA